MTSAQLRAEAQRLAAAVLALQTDLERSYTAEQRDLVATLGRVTRHHADVLHRWRRQERERRKAWKRAHR